MSILIVHLSWRRIHLALEFGHVCACQCRYIYLVNRVLKNRVCTVGHKSHDPCFHKKHMGAGVMTFVAHCDVGTGAVQR